MKRLENLSGCACCPVNRRRFLATGCAACAGATGLLAATRSAAASDQKKTRVHLVYSIFDEVQPRATWPHIGFDFRPVMARVESRLKEACPGIEFVTSMADGPEAAKKIVARDADAKVDGYLVMQMNNWPRVVQTIAATGKPTLLADFTYGGSGGFDLYTAELLRKNRTNFGFVASSNLDDLIASAKCFEAVGNGATESFAAMTARVRCERTREPGDLACKPDDLKVLDTKDCLAAMKQGKILAIGGRRNQVWNAITDQLGIEVVDVPYAELNAAWEAADKQRSNEFADRWQKTARKIEDVSRKTLEESGAMYLAQKTLLARHGANAITINCLGGFYGNHIHAYPCLGFHELYNDGLIGACECDLYSTATMVALTAMTQGRPGFISDPVIDTSKRQIIYAHCVASNRVFGPQGESNPIEILTHSEDRKGASVRSLCPTGYMTTTVKFAPERKSMIFHQGKAVETPIEDRACRTKLAAEPVGDFEKLFGEWDRWGWHRVTYYGDLKEPVFALADALGWKVVEEA
ncbi:MAG TPA: hypothetical protein DD670_07115 [Planctomycetaceae bacterium]|nr:hypothetical protein [Planctomycetaceae bacterium]